MRDRLIEMFLQLTEEQKDAILALLEEPDTETENPDYK